MHAGSQTMRIRIYFKYCTRDTDPLLAPLILMHAYWVQQFLLESGLRVAVAVTKSDKIRKGELQGIPSAMRALLAPVACAPELVDLNLLPITPVSSATGEGKTELWKIIRNSLLAEE